MDIYASPNPETKYFSGEGLTPEWSAVRAEVLNELIAERGGVDAVTRMLLERLSYLYARIRQKEAQGAFGNDRLYKSAMTLLSSFMAEVRKADNRSEMMDLMKADVADLVVRGVKEAVHDLPAEDQKLVMGRVLTLVSTPPSATG